MEHGLILCSTTLPRLPYAEANVEVPTIKANAAKPELRRQSKLMLARGPVVVGRGLRRPGRFSVMMHRGSWRHRGSLRLCVPVAENCLEECQSGNSRRIGAQDSRPE